jgi:hypothetical protein
MARNPTDVERLCAVRDELRKAVADQPWLADKVREATQTVGLLRSRFDRAYTLREAQNLAAARRVLESGRLGYRDADKPSLGYFDFHGECPKALADKVPTGEGAGTLSIALERKLAAAALAALNKRASQPTEDARSEPRRGQSVFVLWRVWHGERLPPLSASNPMANDPDALSRFSDSDRRAIALHRLGGLHDVGCANRVVPRPSDDAHLRAMLDERARVGTPRDQWWDRSVPDPHEMPPDLFLQFWHGVQPWIRAESARRSATPAERAKIDADAALSAWELWLSQHAAYAEPTEALALTEEAIGSLMRASSSIASGSAAHPGCVRDACARVRAWLDSHPVTFMATAPSPADPEAPDGPRIVRHKHRARKGHENWRAIFAIDEYGAEELLTVAQSPDLPPQELRDPVEAIVRTLTHWRDAVTMAASTLGPGVDRSTSEASPKLPKTRRGMQRLAETATTDTRIVAALKEGKSYRKAARECGVSKTTVERVAKAYGLTGHAPESVPLEGTLEENLSVRGKPRKRGTK